MISFASLCNRSVAPLAVLAFAWAGAAFAAESVAAPGATAPEAPVAITADTPVPAVSCLASPAKLSDEAVKDFLDDPGRVLTQYLSGGLPISNAVRFLVASDSRALEPVINLLGDANSSQLSGIASGLARATYVCSNGQEVYSAIIQARVAEVDDETFLLAYSDTLGDIQTAALPPGAAPSSVAPAPGISGAAAKGAGTKGFFRDETTPQTAQPLSINRRSLFVYNDDDDDNRATRPVSPTMVGR